MHAMWKGTIQIAKMQIPIKLYAATEDKEISLKQTHAVCGGAVSHLKYCQACEAKLEMNDIRKVYDLGGGNFVELLEEELKEIAPQASKTFLIEQFADESEISRIRLKKHYYIGAEALGEEAFRLFHASLVQSGKVGIGYITLRSAQSLAAVWPTTEGLILSTMLYDDEIRQMERIVSPSNRVHAQASQDHLFVFQQLIQAMTSEFIRSKYINKYDEALKILIDKKISTLAPQEKPKDEPFLQRETNMEQLLSSLTASLDFAKSDSRSVAQPEDHHLH
ncbi:Ku protein [Cohnella terricola]|uniref:Ku domain-containing protein n=1 Tax=Cohnella terricola TaxID=1289167 RepID=A0A559JNI0_9BACL|nr:Ku protein [Cohnella terricola]TVY01435.1 hypothetical protein FPZ45_09885 [Cohnella terricola]